MEYIVTLGILYIIYLFVKDIDFKQFYKKYKWNIMVLYTPACWLQNKHYCKHWDKKLNDLMEKHKFKIYSYAVAKLDNCDNIWIKNHPYASFTKNGLRPKRSTILKAYDKLQRDSYKG